ncbi:hypothetical protein EV215_1326 [Hypnocyclicus thermotrophus]|uniref:Type IV pilus assembly protein PilO n=1 Tax=Hypnocyclicus thermotrophus TaxID=1627895 RepID=A0AA46DYL2_9FUSO|nr:hypothetical protein [Hypnocyclicus thermotrophus]TDT69787.1 hypothetical protein EV215_1326 [Hypnocyclicus thermotrophus]
MEIFGRDIDFSINTDFTEKQLKISIIILSIAILIALLVPMIIMPSLSIRSKIKELKSVEVNLQKITTTYIKEKKKYNKQLEIYEAQKKDLKELEIKFKNSTIKDNTGLKIMIDDIAEYIGVKIIEIGSIEIGEDKKGYTKKYIPYTVVGDILQISRFLYFLENSDFLITLKGSSILINRINNDKVQVKFKIGAYFIKEEGEINFE